MNEITIHTADISSEVRYPIRVPNPNETVEQIIQDMQNEVILFVSRQKIYLHPVFSSFYIVK